MLNICAFGFPMFWLIIADEHDTCASVTVLLNNCEVPTHVLPEVIRNKDKVPLESALGINHFTQIFYLFNFFHEYIGENEHP